MGFIKGMVFGAAVYAAVQYLAKKDLLTGRSRAEELIDKAPEYIETVKEYARKAEREFVEPEVRI